MKVYEILNEDGRIVKGVNTTVDVGVDQIPIEASKFGNTVDKNGRPPTLSKKVKGSKTNVLFNLGLAESIDDKTKNNYKEFIRFCAKRLGIEKLPPITVTNKALPKTFGFYNIDEDSITVSYNGRHQMDTMRTLAHELVHCKQREEKEELDGSDGSPDENEANAMAGVLLRRWAEHNPRLFTENFADGKEKGKSRPGRVKRSGASCNGSVTSLRKRAKNSSGEKARMYHWCANMKSGRKKKS